MTVSAIPWDKLGLNRTYEELKLANIDMMLKRV